MDKRGLGFVALVAAVFLALGVVWMALGSVPTPAPQPTVSPVASVGPHGVPAASAGPHGALENLRIAFSSNRDGNNEIYVLVVTSTDDGVPRLMRLTDHQADDEGATWAPDGTRLAFESDRDGNWEIYLMNADGSGVTRLTHHPADDYFSAWSPDGQYIAFVSERDGNGNLYLLDVEQALQSGGAEGEVIRLTDNPAHDTQPAWSPDGQRIVFTSDRDGNPEIYVLDVQGALQGTGDSALVRLTNHLSNDHYPAWSPDGTRIAFASARDGYEDEIYLMNVDSTDLTRLTDNKAADSRPTWSPDGMRIAFQTRRDGNWEVYVMASDGSEQTNLTNAPTSDGIPAWAPE